MGGEVLRSFTQFDEDASCGLWMEEGNLGAAGPFSWLLIDQLNSIFSTLPSVVAAYALEIGDEHTSKERGLLIAVAVPQKDAERVARAVITNLHGCVEHFERSIDLTSFEPGDTPDWLDAAEVAPFYERAPTGNLVLSHIQVH